VGSSGFIVFDDSRSMAQVARITTRFLFVESCSQCISCKVGLGMTSEALDDLCAGRPGTSDPLTRAMEAVVRAPTNNRCALPMGATMIVPSLVKAFPDDFKPGAPEGEPWLLPKLVDYDEKAHAFTYDEHAVLKQPDWTYSDETAPAQA
jgi:NADH:ubiquinone oxidoreductase subunit F (NADH-binding)